MASDPDILDLLFNELKHSNANEALNGVFQNDLAGLESEDFDLPKERNAEPENNVEDVQKEEKTTSIVSLNKPKEFVLDGTLETKKAKTRKHKNQGVPVAPRSEAKETIAGKDQETLGEGFTWSDFSNPSSKWERSNSPEPVLADGSTRNEDRSLLTGEQLAGRENFKKDAEQSPSLTTTTDHVVTPISILEDQTTECSPNKEETQANPEMAEQGQTTSSEKDKYWKGKLYFNEDGWCLTEEDMDSIRVEIQTKTESTPSTVQPAKGGLKATGGRSLTAYGASSSRAPKSRLLTMARSLGGALEDVETMMEKRKGTSPYLPCLQCAEESGTHRFGRYTKRDNTESAFGPGKCSKCGGKLTKMSGMFKGIESFYKFVEEKGFDVHDVSHSGNCQFEAVIDQLRINGDFEYRAQELRQAAVQYLRDNPTFNDGTSYEEFMTTESWPSYLDRMNMDKQWGDQFTLTALANVLHRKIVVYANTGSEAVTEILPQNTESIDSTEPLYIGHLGETHYVSLRKNDMFTQHQGENDTWQHDGIVSVEILDLMLNQLTGAEVLLSFQPTKETTSRNKRVGPLTCGLVPKPYSASKGVLDSLDSYLDSIEGKKHTRTLLMFQKDSEVASDRRMANPKDVYVLGQMDDVFRLKPFRSFFWHGLIVVSGNEETIAWPSPYPSTFPSFVRSAIFTCFTAIWPSVATEWIARKRRSNFLSGETIKRIVDKGCEITPARCEAEYTEILDEYVTSDMAEHKNIWFTSFAMAEKEVCKHLSTDHVAAYVLVKTWIGPMLEKHNIPNAVLTNTFYYACENIEESVWMNNPCQCVFILLRKVFDGFQKHSVSSYFIATKNLLRNVPGDIIKEVAEHLGQQVHRPIPGLRKALDRLKITTSEFGTLVDDCFKQIVFTPRDKIGHSTIRRLIRIAEQNIENCVEKYMYKESVRLIEKLKLQAMVVFEIDKQVEEIALVSTASLPIYSRWCLLVLIDKNHLTGCVQTLLDGQETVPIADVFGPNSPSLVLDTSLPKSALTENGNVMFAYSLAKALRSINNTEAVVQCLKYYLKRYADLAQDTIVIPIDGNTQEHIRCLHTTSQLETWDSSDTYDHNDEVTIEYIHSYVASLYFILYNALAELKRIDEFVEYVPHLQQVIEALNYPSYTKRLRYIKRSLEEGDDDLDRCPLS